MNRPKRRKRTPTQVIPSQFPSPSSPDAHPVPRTLEEQRQLEAALKRERALLWTDDRPFSIWKE